MTSRPVERFKSSVRIFVALILAGVVGVWLWNVSTERSNTLARAGLQAAGYARALAEHSESAFAESDRMVRDLQFDIQESGGADRVDHRAMFDEMRRLTEGAPQVGTMFLVDRKGGMFVNSNEFPGKPIDVSDRDYFRYYRSNPDAGLTIGKPVLSRLVNRWRFNLMRPLGRPGEPFDGLVAVAFEVDYFRKFFDPGGLGQRGRVLLIRDDGAPLVCEPDVDNVSDVDFCGSKLFLEALPKAPAGTYRVEASHLGREPRIISYRRISRYPVIAVVSLHEGEVLAPWRRRAIVQGVLTAALMILALLLTRSMFHQLDRVRETQETLAEQRKEQGRLEEQLRHIQKIEAIGQLAGGVAHDFNNLLTPIIVSAELARRSLHRDDPLNGRMDGILSAAHKAKELTQKLLSFARKQMLTMTTIDLNRVVTDFREILRRTIRGDITIDLKTVPGSAAIRGDQGQIEQILLNLAVNAQDAIEGNGRISIEIGRVRIDEALAGANPGMRQGPHVYLSVSDDGCGMTRDVLDHVFEPFFTSKPVGQGTGLGLATVYGIVKQHEGYVRVDSRPGEGTTFTLYFPASGEEEEARPEAPAAEPHAVTTGDSEVLVVEDNEMVRSLVVGMLGTFGYRVRETASPGEALRIASDAGNRIDLLVSDMIMPEMNGQSLYEQIRELRPGLPVLFISGYTQDAVIPQVRPGEEVRFLKKPFTMSEFLTSVRAALGES
jgi:signal transduction histidine kinase/ActR/RegA family two-component response regulator